MTLSKKYFLGDSGYQLRPYFCTPLRNPQTPGEIRYNEAHIRTRNCIERFFGIWKRRFPVLAIGMRVKLQTRLAIIVAVAVLHNIALEMHEEQPPPPEDVNLMELEHLIEEGQMPPVNIEEDIFINAREDLINRYFAHLL
ncbi:hypothetical protein NQ314_009961 [Rhamnusium bicolor]|uniref:DDE Tnp4 domain-containing protein n=1 Tax=Rhamnusium bicolor TaxID=1586634 RepID=A0AAV8XV39_9CUCU|nr:hypothetical protein NQ314_009961 [Rhamnusium bicolor]